MDFLIKNLLKVKSTDHRKIQEEIQRNLSSLGYEVKLEKKIRIGREGKIDVFAQKGGYTMGLEVDHSQLRKKSIEKLNALNPSLAVFLLKARNINRQAIDSRAKLIRVNAIMIHLPEKKVEKIGPGFSEYKEKAPAEKQKYRKFERSKKAPDFKVSAIEKIFKGNFLTERQKNILRLRIEGKTFAEIGDYFGITRERVRQIGEQIKKKLRESLIDEEQKIYIQLRRKNRSIKAKVTDN